MDFLINYYVVFLMNNHLSMTTGFFIWHAVTFLIMLFLLCLSVYIFNLISQKISLNVFGTDSVINGDAVQSRLISSDFLAVLAAAAVIFMWLLLSLTISLYPLKTDVGVFFFTVFLFVPLLYFLGSIELTDDKDSIRRTLKKVLFCCGANITVILSVLSVFMLTDSPSFRDIVSVQNVHGFLSMFCFPCTVGVLVIFYSLASIHSFLNSYKTENPVLKFFINAFFITICAYLVILFFGGYVSPFPFLTADLFEHSSVLYGLVLSVEQFFWLIVKTFLLYICIILINNRFVSEIKTDYLWKLAIPLALLNFILVAFTAINFGDFYVL